MPPNLFIKAVSGRGREERLLKSRLIQHPTDWSRDGRAIVFAMLDPDTEWDLWLVPMTPDAATGSRTEVPLLRAGFNQHNGQISPDGRWLAYESDEAGEFEIYLREFPLADRAPRQISTDGGVWPVWRHDGKELFFIARDGGLMAVPVSVGPDLNAGAPTRLFKTHIAEAWWRIRNYSVARDGKRFLINTVAEQANAPTTSVVLNWPAALRR